MHRHVFVSPPEIHVCLKLGIVRILAMGCYRLNVLVLPILLLPPIAFYLGTMHTSNIFL